MASSTLQRLNPLLDVLGAALIFGSWISSSALSQRAQDQTASHQAIVDRVHRFRLYEDFTHRFRDLQSDLLRTHELVEEFTEDARLSGRPPGTSPEVFTWTGMSAPQVREVNDFMNDLEGYSAKLPAAEGRSRALTVASDGVEAISRAFRSARDVYERLVAQVDEPVASPTSSSDSDSEKDLELQIDSLWKQYDSAKQSMLEVGDQLLREASTQAEAASAVAAKSKRLSWALYALGTLIILAGRAAKALDGKARNAG
jgi:hypothetical protein